MPLVRLFIIKDPSGNLYLQTIRTTEKKSIEVFLSFMESEGESEVFWGNFENAGFKAVSASLIVSDLPNKKVVKKTVKKSKKKK